MLRKINRLLRNVFNSIKEINILRKINTLLSNVFNSVKEINRLRKINRLLSKGMSNMYLKVTIKTFSKL